MAQTGYIDTAIDRDTHRCVHVYLCVYLGGQKGNVAKRRQMSLGKGCYVSVLCIVLSTFLLV